MSDETPSHERPCPTIGGDPPQSAARDLRRILGTSGGIPRHDLAARRAAEIEALIAWAGERGWLDARYFLTPAREGGLEHRLWLDEASNRVIKITLPGRFGRTLRSVDARPDRQELHHLVRFESATPLEYLDRLALHNDAFGDDVRVLGPIHDGLDEISIVITQQFLRGSRPTDREVRDFMQRAGFRQLGAEPAFFRPADRVAAFDAHSANFVRTEGETVPFDLITFHADGAMSRLLESFLCKE
jgi:hypothetical protein